jgi:hypothetical protein
MTRIAVYRYDDYDETGSKEPQGWFTLESAEAFAQADPFTEHIAPVEHTLEGVTEAMTSGHDGPIDGLVETLYRTAGGRWVRKTAMYVGENGQWVEAAPPRYAYDYPRYEFLTPVEALDWLQGNGYAARAEELVADQPAEQGPGRPEIGGRVQVRLGDLLEQVDAYAKQQQCSRAEAVRMLVAAGLASQP